MTEGSTVRRIMCHGISLRGIRRQGIKRWVTVFPISCPATLFHSLNIHSNSNSSNNLGLGDLRMVLEKRLINVLINWEVRNSKFQSCILVQIMEACTQSLREPHVNFVKYPFSRRFHFCVLFWRLECRLATNLSKVLRGSLSPQRNIDHGSGHHLMQWLMTLCSHLNKGHAKVKNKESVFA